MESIEQSAKQLQSDGRIPMFSNHWKWLLLALCSSTGIACGTPRCQQCHSRSAGPYGKTSVASAGTSCMVEKAVPIREIAIEPCPSEQPGVFVIVPKEGAADANEKAPAISEIPMGPRSLAPSIADLDRVEKHVVGKPESHALVKENRTPGAQYGHSPVFAWVVGRLEYLHAEKQWRVRFVPYDVDDSYGGVLTLQGVDHMSDQLKSGATVRIDGQLVDPDTQKSSPEYQVYEIKTLE
jgi:hypothetical protein